MNNSHIATAIAIRDLHCFTLETLNDRILLQKKVYLAQDIGLPLGYGYSWYIHGPYSPDLTNYIYDNLDMLKDHDFSSYKLSDAAQNAVDTINNLECTKPETLTTVSWYELLASLLYIIRKWNAENPYEALIKYKPKYTKADYDAAMAQLQGIGLAVAN